MRNENSSIWTKPSGLEIRINNSKATVAYAIELGWINDKYNPQKIATLENMDKNQLETYAREKHGIDLDKRKSLENLIEEVKGYGNSK